MHYLVEELENLGFTWAYRIVDTRAFGLPQRRQRVLLLASRSEDPRPVLFGVDSATQEVAFSTEQLCGFYWTEGLRGLGWAVNCVPTLKGGSTIGIPSPPGIWDPLDGSISTPEIRDAERLQGFDEDWTAPALEADGVRRGHRWRLVGNALSVPVAEWVGRRLTDSSIWDAPTAPMTGNSSWPTAAWGHRGKRFKVGVSNFPTKIPMPNLRDFLRFPRQPLSQRAGAGFLSRAQASSLTFETGFLEDVRRHIDRMSATAAA
jgi:DNA (cytosine-5)-methyltransferase 1